MPRDPYRDSPGAVNVNRSEMCIEAQGLQITVTRKKDRIVSLMLSVEGLDERVAYSVKGRAALDRIIADLIDARERVFGPKTQEN